MGMSVRRALAAGLMLGALVLASLAMSGGVAAQQAGVIQTTGLPKVSASNLATSATALSVPQAVPAFPGYPFGYGNYFGYGYNPYYGYGYPYTGANYSFPYYGYNYGYNYGYSYPYSGYSYGYAGCVPTVSYTAAFGYGYGCQRVYP